MNHLIPKGYSALLAELKERIRSERLRVVMAANSALVMMYWDIGQRILARQNAEGWGAKVIARLSKDLRKAFPDMTGLSTRNLKYMRAFAATWPDIQIVQQAVAQIPWSHNIILMEKLKEQELRLWYAAMAREHGWSRSILVMQIEGRLHERQGNALTNFPQTLPPEASDMAAQIFKDPYLFDFLGTADPRREREVEQALVDHIQQFLLEMGVGFAFVGRQYTVSVGDKDYFIDLLFYHLRLRCFVVIELKAIPFEPGFAGQLNFYTAVVDDKLRHPTDGPTIGLLLCRGRDRLTAEYALRGINRPLGVVNWETELVRQLPEELKSSLPTVEELELELSADLGEE